MFADIEDKDDRASGYAYVLRSKSDHPFVAEHRTVLHKIGVTGGDVNRRVSNARKDPTFLLADVEVIATYKLANINRKKLEALLHRFFASARMDVELKDRFGSSVEPKEWFLVGLDVIQEVIQRLIDGTIEQVRFDWQTGNLHPR